MSQVAVRERWAMSVEAKGLFVVSAILLAFGLAVLYSASALEAQRLDRPGSFFLIKQLQGAIMGAVLFAIAAKVDADRWSDWAWPIMGAAIFFMLVIVIPGMPESIAPTIYRANRYLSIPGIGSVQPSEFAKLAVIIWTAMLVVKKGGALRHLLKGLTPFFLVVGLLAILAAKEPDVSIALTFILIMSVILYSSGARIGHFIFLGAIGTPFIWNFISSQEYVMRRIYAVFGSGDGVKEGAEQLTQSLIAVGSGGLLGRGFGEGMQQTGWVSMGHNDFIGSIIGEEWGFVGIVFVMALYCLYGFLGFRIAEMARSRFQQLVAIGITFTMIVTAFVHMGVVTGLLPTTGLTLPFISDGRSNLILSMVMTGILVNIGSSRERVFGDAADPGGGVVERVPVATST